MVSEETKEVVIKEMKEGKWCMRRWRKGSGE